MADDSSEPMAKALQAGRSQFPCGPYAPKPYPRPMFFRLAYPTNEVNHDIHCDERYTMHLVENGWRYTYHDVKCVPSTAGPCIDTADCKMVTAAFVGE